MHSEPVESEVISTLSVPLSARGREGDGERGREEERERGREGESCMRNGAVDTVTPFTGNQQRHFPRASGHNTKLKGLKTINEPV